MRRVHEAYVSQGGLDATLLGLGILGVVPVGALAWTCYPPAAPAPVIAPGPDGFDGFSIGLVAPNVIATPYYVTHLAGTVRHKVGGRINRWRLSDGLGTTKRVFRCQNSAKSTGGNNFGTIITEGMFPFQMPANAGVQLTLALDNNPQFDAESKFYLQVLATTPIRDRNLLAVAPTASGAVLPTTAAGTVATASATEWVFGNYVQLTAGLATGALITAVVFSSNSINDGQVAFATGGAGSEVDWGIFGWPEPEGSDTRAARYSLSPFPVYLPASTRLAVRVRANQPGDTWNCGVEYIPIPLR